MSGPYSQSSRRRGRLVDRFHLSSLNALSTSPLFLSLALPSVALHIPTGVFPTPPSPSSHFPTSLLSRGANPTPLLLLSTHLRPSSNLSTSTLNCWAVFPLPAVPFLRCFLIVKTAGSAISGNAMCVEYNAWKDASRKTSSSPMTSWYIRVRGYAWGARIIYSRSIGLRVDFLPDERKSAESRISRRYGVRGM